MRESLIEIFALLAVVSASELPSISDRETVIEFGLLVSCGHPFHAGNQTVQKAISTWNKSGRKCLALEARRETQTATAGATAPISRSANAGASWETYWRLPFSHRSTLGKCLLTHAGQFCHKRYSRLFRDATGGSIYVVIRDVHWSSLPHNQNPHSIL